MYYIDPSIWDILSVKLLFFSKMFQIDVFICQIDVSFSQIDVIISQIDVVISQIDVSIY